MHHPHAADGPPSEDTTSADAELSGQVMRVMRVVGSVKTQLHARHRSSGADWAAYPVLLHLLRHGAMRASTLAEGVCSDPSTVSRQTAALVDAGLVERHPDPEDGRAVLIAPTERGTALFARMRRDNERIFAGVLVDWDDADKRHLADLLGRLGDSFEQHRGTLVDLLGAAMDERHAVLAGATPLPTDTTDRPDDDVATAHTTPTTSDPVQHRGAHRTKETA